VAGGGINLSPDGQYIATAFLDPTAADDRMIVLLVPTSGDGPRELLRVPSKALPDCPGQTRGFRAWEPDSRSFFVQACTDGKQTEMWRVFVNGDAPQKLTARSLPGPWPAVHPDRRHIAYVVTPQRTGDGLAEIWALENFLPTLKVNK